MRNKYRFYLEEKHFLGEIKLKTFNFESTLCTVRAQEKKTRLLFFFGKRPQGNGRHIYKVDKKNIKVVNDLTYLLLKLNTRST